MFIEFHYMVCAIKYNIIEFIMTLQSSWLIEANSCGHQFVQIKDIALEYFERVVRQNKIRVDMKVP